MKYEPSKVNFVNLKKEKIGNWSVARYVFLVRVCIFEEERKEKVL